MNYLWRIPEDWPQEWIARYDQTRSVDRFALLNTQRVSATVSITLQIDVAGKRVSSWDSIPNTAKLPIINDRVLEVLAREAGDSCQFIPAIVNAAGSAVNGFHAVVVTKAIEAIDRTRSKFTCIPGTDKIMRFDELVTRPDAFGPACLGRDPEYLPLLFVADRLKKAISALRPVGIAFEPIFD